MITPHVSPKEWNTGNAIMNLSSGVKSPTARICATFDRIDAWECTTPLGRPSDPEVNSTIAGSSADCGTRDRVRRQLPYGYSQARPATKSRPQVLEIVDLVLP